MRNAVYLSLLLLFAVPALAAAPVFFVAPNGNDAWTGTVADPNANNSDGPFATLTRARDALRATGTPEGLPDGGTVAVRGGTYFLREPLRLEARDSGTTERPVLWQAYRDERVRLVGGVAVSGFQPHAGAIVRADCAALGMPEPVQQLFLDGVRQTLARWPNKGEGALPGGGWAFIGKQAAEQAKRAFYYDGDAPAQWAGIPGIEISIWPNYNWWQTISPVASIDPATKLLTLPQDISYTIEPGRRYFLQNAMAMLDAPGEWFYDAAQKAIYSWPPAPLGEAAEVVVPVADSVLVAQGVQHAAIIGLSAEATRGDGVVFTDCQDVLFARATVRNTYGVGVTVTGGQSVRVHGNDIYGTGKGGIVLSGGDRATLSPGNHEAMNNHIHHYAELFNTYHCAININGVANKIRHNLIHDAPHIGILLTGNDHVIEYNDIHHVCLQGADNGGFYMGRDWTQRGNVIRYNKFHDIYGFGLGNLEQNKEGKYRYESPHQAWGVYLDDCSSGTEIYGNIFYRVPLAGVMIGGGRDNKVHNNIFVECTPALHIDDRWDSYPWDLMNERLAAMKPAEPPYSERYPELNTMGDDPRTPANNHFERNVVYYTKDDFRGLSSTAPTTGNGILYDLAGFDPASTVINDNLIDLRGNPARVHWRAYKSKEGSGDLSWEEWRAKGFDERSVQEKVTFVDPEHDDFRLFYEVKSALTLKIEAIPGDQIGLVRDEFRVTWPVEPDTRRDGATHTEWQINVTP